VVAVSIDLDMPDPEYRAVPALSYSGAKTLMRSPALFAYELEHGRPDKTEFDVGHAAHALLLGAGAPLAVAVDPKTNEPFKDWRTKAAQEFAKAARERGETPLLAAQEDAVVDMVTAVRSHPFAGKLFEPGRGVPEVSLFWTDDATGTPQKARLDWLIVENDEGRPEVVDLKTCTDVRRIPLVKHVVEHSYHWQGPHYVDGGLAAHGVDGVLWRWVFVEKTPPHLVRVVEPDAEMWAAGRRFMGEARRRYAAYLERGAPIDYPTAELLGLPRYAATDPEDLLP
jgi:hypothetical protein